MLNSTTTTIQVKGPSKKKDPTARTRGVILQELSAMCDVHFILFVRTVWYALGIDCARTHFLAIVVRRNFSAKRTTDTHTLVDAEVLPLQVLEKKAEWESTFDAGGFNPVDILRDAEKKGEAENPPALGMALVIITEVNDKELRKAKSVEDTMMNTAIQSISTIGLYKHIHAQLASTIPTMSRQWKMALKMELDGIPVVVKPPPEAN